MSVNAASDWKFPFWIAHRGAGKLAPENTLAAFRLGASYGYRTFECDVKLSADGVPFLLHDATLDRTTNGKGPAGERTWAELSQLDAGSWHSRTYAGEPIPTLQAVAAFCLANSFALDLEIKPSPGRELETGQVVARVAAQLWQGAGAPPLMFSSFRPEALQGARESAPYIPRALLVDTLWRGWLPMAKALECVAVITNHEVMNRPTLKRIHAEGMRAMVYTVNEAKRADALKKLGIDGVVTDAVDRFSPAA
jgi:glycerophosphoryl diester phosphodiesterase